MAVELRNALARGASSSLPATLLFDHPTIQQLVHFLAREVLAVPLAPTRRPAGTAGAPPPERPEARSEEDMALLLAQRLNAIDQGTAR
jgi:hypothetical protein